MAGDDRARRRLRIAAATAADSCTNPPQSVRALLLPQRTTDAPQNTMAPSPWVLRAVEGLAGALPQPAGLLLGVVDEGRRTIVLLGATPVAAAAASAKDIAAAAGAWPS